ncbi:MAG: SAM-dependent methyltransferase [Deltaproteobacteria bacterium]|nr:SAM-dependent methyltransferase [Deltaproteobacteria bacterium]
MDVIEPFTPYAQSLMWRLHRAYYAQRGVHVWTRQEIPSIATTNLGHARLHARMFAACARPGPGPAVALEVGGGSGAFATAFLHALEQEAPALAARTRYVLSDFAPETLAAAAALPTVAPWVAAGRLVTAPYDLERPDDITLPGPPSMVMANYVCCALPMRPIDVEGDAWKTPWVETRADLRDRSRDEFVAALLADAEAHGRQDRITPTFEWRALDAGELGAPDADVLRRATAGLERARVLLPERWFAFMRAIAPRLAPGGLIVTSDYGFVERERLTHLGPDDRLTERFADSLGQEVQFALFDDLGASLGWEVARTRDPLDEVHVAVVGPRGVAPDVRKVLDDRLWGRTEAGQLLDFREAARVLEAQGDRERALRFWLRCAAIDPLWPEPRERVADLAIDTAHTAVAEEHLAAGRELTPDAAIWEHLTGRLAAARGDAEAARVHWMQAFMLEPRAATAVELARAALATDDLGGAFRWLERALSTSPDDKAAQALMHELRDRSWRASIAHYRDEGAFAIVEDE